MEKFYARVCVAAIFVCAFVSSGCVMMKRDHKVSKVVSFPQSDRKPAVRVAEYDLKSYGNGKAVDVLFVDYAQVRRKIQKGFEKTKLFSDVANVEKGYDFDVSIEDRYETKYSVLESIFSCATLMLLPSSSTFTYSMTAYVKNRKSGEVKKLILSETAENWNHLIFLPVGIVRPPRCVISGIQDDLIENIAVAVHGEILKMEGDAGRETGRGATSSMPSGVSGDAGNGDEALVKKLRLLKEAKDAGLVSEQDYQQKRGLLLKGL